MTHNEKEIRDLLSEVSMIAPRYQYSINEPDTWIKVKKDIESMLHKYTDCAHEIEVEVTGEGSMLKIVIKPLTDRAIKFLEELPQT